VDDPHCVWGFFYFSFFPSFCGEIFSLGHRKKRLWAMICTKGIKIEHQISLLLVFLFELTQNLNIGISLLLDPNPKLNPFFKKLKKGTSSLSRQAFFIFLFLKTNK
jgi:hypothetical protein